MQLKSSKLSQAKKLPLSSDVLPKYIGKRGRVIYEGHHKPVATWIAHRDYELLVRLATLHGVKVSVYLRAIITDALQDERLHEINIKAS